MLVVAYDDKEGSLGVQPEHSESLYRELSADFDLAGFRHGALWNPVESRIKMHLESELVQNVYIATAGLDLRFRNGETIHTENITNSRTRRLAVF